MRINFLFCVLLITHFITWSGSLSNASADTASDEGLQEKAEEYNQKQRHEGYKVICKKEARTEPA